MQGIATVTSKGQVTLPVAVRRALSIRSGTKVSFTVEGAGATLQVAPDFLALAGTVATPSEVRGADWGTIKDLAYQRLAQK